MNRLISLCITSLLLIACSGTTPTVNPAQGPTVPSTMSEIQQAIIEADKLGTAEANTRYIALAEQLIVLGEIQAANDLFKQLDIDELDDPQYLQYALTASQLFIDSQAIFDAYDILTADRLLSLRPLAEPEKQIQFYRLRAELFNQLGDTQGSVTERIALSSLLNDPLDLTENHDALWQLLTGLSLETLNALIANQQDEISRGWYELAALNKTYESDLDTLQREVNRWLSVNTNHPASIEVPLDLQLLTTLIEERPRKIALLLPLTGKLATAGKAIRDGFFVAYFNHGNELKPEVKLFDTAKEPINQLYDRAVAEGVDLIIGPLQKDKVATLQARGNLPITTLALNYTAKRSSANKNNTPEIVVAQDPFATNVADELTTRPLAETKRFYQFGLSLEDEAIQAADRAWLEGHRYAMVIASSADWSSRAADTFVQRWRQQGGKVVIDRRFDKGSNYSNTIKSAFSIDQSEQRVKKLQRLFGQKLEFEPRRRQDIDMIFLVARSSEGQQIKPTLAFHYAGKLPVYATSQIYSSSQNSSKNRDLNGIRFTTLPWTLEPDNPDKRLINKYTKVPPNYERLYAMGVDTYLLHDRLKQLARSEAVSVFGKTGKLRLDKEQRIVREQPWAEIVKGSAEPLIYLTKKADSEL